MTDRQRHAEPAFDADEQLALETLGLAGTTAHRRRGCPDPALLLALDEGVLDDGLAGSVRAHVSSCPACQAAAADLSRIFDDDVPDDARRRMDARIAARRPAPANGLWYWLVPAGGLALATAGLIWALVPRPVAPPVPESRTAQLPPQAPLPTVFVVDRPAIPPGDIDLTVRGDTTMRTDLETRIGLALDRADGGDVAGAIGDLGALVRTNPESRKAGLALGALQLRAGRDAEAAATLERVRGVKTDPDVDDEVDWFLAIARLRAGDRAGARSLVEAICRRGGPRGARACAGMTEIDRPPTPR